MMFEKYFTGCRFGLAIVHFGLDQRSYQLLNARRRHGTSVLGWVTVFGQVILPRRSTRHPSL